MGKDSSNQDEGIISSSELRNGPLTDRKCTDILCCILFTLFVAGSVYISIYSLSTGDIKLMMTPTDAEGKLCGYDKRKDYKFIYFASPDRKYLWRTVCVKKCPTKNDKKLECYPNKYIKSCKGVSGTTIGLQVENHADLQLQSSQRQLATAVKIDYSKTTVIYPTTETFGIMCFPNSKKIEQLVLKGVHLGDKLSSTKDFGVTWPIMLVSLAIALIFGFTFCLLMRCCSKLIVWSLVIGFNLLFLLSALICVQQYFNYKVDLSNRTITQKASGDSKENKDFYFYGMIILSILWVLVTIITCCLCNKIRLAIGIIETSALFLRENFVVIFLPIINFIILATYIIFAVISLAYLYATGKRQFKEKSLPFNGYKHDETQNYYLAYQIFALFWIINFILGSLDFILCSAACIWYYKNEEQQRSLSPCFTSIRRFFIYHVGTVAFGSLLLAIVWAIQLLLEYLTQQMQSSGADQNAVVSGLIKCCRCCLDCFERFIRFINRNAYTITAMTGNGFCSSAKDAFNLMIRDPVQFAIVSYVGDLFVCIGKIFITMLTAIIGYFIITHAKQYKDSISSPWPSTIIFAIIGYMIGTLFMSIYGTVADACIVIFLMDQEITKYHGNQNKVNRCPEPLEKFMDNLQ